MKIHTHRCTPAAALFQESFPWPAEGSGPTNRLSFRKEIYGRACNEQLFHAMRTPGLASGGGISIRSSSCRPRARRLSYPYPGKPADIRDEHRPPFFFIYLPSQSCILHCLYMKCLSTDRKEPGGRGGGGGGEIEDEFRVLLIFREITTAFMLPSLINSLKSTTRNYFSVLP